MTGEAAATLLELSGVGKHYGAVRALSDVSFAVRRGETLAICGDNGAGKSTLIKIVSGAQPPSTGTIRLSGEEVRFASPADALRQGVATIYQDLALAPTMTIAQNVFLGSELTRRILGVRVLDKRRMRREAAEHLSRLRLAVPDMGRHVSDLSGGQRQAVAIARALRWRAEIVIMDEPTAALGVRETRLVLGLIKEIAAQGITVILISHNMADVVEVAERAVVLRAGRLLKDTSLDGWTADDLSHVIMGHEAA